MEKICHICSKRYLIPNYFPPKQQLNSKYCSRNCYYQSRKGKITWNKGTKGLLNVAEKNGQWKGNNVGYEALHEWVKNRLSQPELCINCYERKAYDLANISQEYKRDLSDWEWLCRHCHMIKDGRMFNLKHQKPEFYE